jgi:hypothetical protein
MEVSLDGSVCRRHQDSAVSIPITLSARLNSVRGGASDCTTRAGRFELTEICQPLRSEIYQLALCEPPLHLIRVSEGHAAAFPPARLEAP